MLTGLGCDKTTGKPLYEEHDTQFNLDVNLQIDDIHEVNPANLL